MATSISAILIPCLKSLNHLQEQVDRPDYGREEEVPSALWGDELGRLRVWAANIGAHQTGQSSLDFRLRDASHISKQVMKLLGDLQQSLHDIFDELSEDENKAYEDDETLADWPGDESTTELQQLHEEIVNIIDCLYQLSMLIRKPAQHDLLVGSRIGDKAEFEFYDKEHVRNLHPKTEEQIGQRLGRAITRRRKYLLYRERHHRKLEKGIEEVQGIQGTTTGSVISETIATDLMTPNIDFEETSSNSGMSQTSYAPSLVDGGRVTIPPPPRDSLGGKSFECPYCFFLIEIKSTRSWNRHIFKDIKPYVCTFPDCSMPDQLYDSRREWLCHETTEHRREGFICPLCKDILISSKQYERHVARHLEELALFALPRTEMDDVEDDNDDVFDARASRGENNVAFDSPSDGSSMERGEKGETSLDASILAEKMGNSPSISGSPTHSEPTFSEDALETKSYTESLEEPYPANDNNGGTDQKRGHYSYPESLFTPMSSMQRTEVALAAAIDKADKDYQPAAEKDKTAATLAMAEEKDKHVKFTDALGRRFNLPFDVVKTWSGMEHLIKEKFLVVPNLDIRVTDGQYDLSGPQDQILSPSNWESMIEPGWEITMRMWPNPERPPRGSAEPWAMLEERHNRRLEKEEEGVVRSPLEQEQNDLHVLLETPRLREPREHRRIRPATELRSGVKVEERRPRTWNERGRSPDSDEWEEVDATPREQSDPYKYWENLRSSDMEASMAEEPARERDEKASLLTRNPSPRPRYQRERSTDDLVSAERSTPDSKAPGGDAKHEGVAVRMRGSGSEAQQAKEPSDETVPITTTGEIGRIIMKNYQHGR